MVEPNTFDEPLGIKQDVVGSKPAKKDNSFTIIVGTLLVVIAIVAGYYFYQSSQIETDVTVEELEVSPEVTDEPSIEEISIEIDNAITNTEDILDVLDDFDDNVDDLAY